MKLALLIFIAAVTIFVYGFYNQALFFMGYLWASLLYPQAFTKPYLSALPLSMIFGLFTVFAFFGRAKERAPLGKMPAGVYIAVSFALWVTFTTVIAKLQHDAWIKWDWAFKSILICVTMPIFIRTRLQLEAAFMVAFSALFAHVATAGIKSVMGTGGYDRLGTLLQTNFWLGETSTLALAAIMSLPMAWYIAKHSSLIAGIKAKYRMLAFAGYVPVALACVVGTSARTGMVSFAVLLVMGVKGIVRKVLVVAVGSALLIFGTPLMPDWWQERMGTIESYKQDTSAMGRIAAWTWAIDYVARNPLGGGFSIFNVSEVVVQIGDTSDWTAQIKTEEQEGKAAHSVYFEILAEHGYLGLALYLALFAGSLLGMYRASWKTKDDPDREWRSPFAHCLFACMMVYAVGSAFIGIGFQPLSYVFFGFYFSLYRIVHLGKKKPVSSLYGQVTPRMPAASPAPPMASG